jgi:putative transposase
VNYRNGGRPRTLSTPAGDVELRIPKVRVGSFFPALLEPRHRVDKALWAVIMTAYITGTSTRKVDDLVKALGSDTGVSKSTVSRICVEIDEQVEVFRTRSLDHLEFSYVFVDATYVKARVDHRIVSRAVVVATGVAADGNREVLGLDVGRLRRRSVLDPVPQITQRPGFGRGPSGHLRRPLRVEERHQPSVPRGPPGRDARSI